MSSEAGFKPYRTSHAASVGRGLTNSLVGGFLDMPNVLILGETFNSFHSLIVSRYKNSLL